MSVALDDRLRVQVKELDEQDSAEREHDEDEQEDLGQLLGVHGDLAFMFKQTESPCPGDGTET